MIYVSEVLSFAKLNFRWWFANVRRSRRFLSRSSLHIHPLSSHSISLRGLINEMQVGNLHTAATMNIAQNPRGEWQFKPPKRFLPLNWTAISIVSTLQFSTHVSIFHKICLFMCLELRFGFSLPRSTCLWHTSLKKSSYIQ